MRIKKALKKVQQTQAPLELPALGFISAKYESGGAGAGTISTGVDDPGGKSYGVHQFSSKFGIVRKYLQWSKYGDEFRGVQIASEDFDIKWKALAEEDKEEFEANQNLFTYEKYYNPAIRFAQNFSVYPVDDRAFQESIYSIAVQHGGYKTIIKEAAELIPGFSPIEALYEARKRYVLRLVTLGPRTKEALLERYENELGDVLSFQSKLEAASQERSF